MDMKKLAMGVVAMVVAIVIVVTCAIPIISDSVASEDKFVNVGSFDMTYSQTEDVTLVWDHTAPGQITVNDVAVTMPTISNGEQRTVICGDNWIVRYGYGDTLGGNFVQWYPSNGASILASQSNGLDLTVTCSSGTVSVTDTASTPNTATGTYTYLYCVANDGAYIMKNATDSVYMNGDSQFYAMGLTNVGTYTSTGIKITGSIDDGATWTTFRGTDFAFTNESMVYEEVSGHKDLYKLTSMSATVTKEDQTANATYSYFIVPAEITAERTSHVDGTIADLISVIPVLMVLGIVIGAIALFIKTKRD